MPARNGQKRTAPRRLLSFDIPGHKETTSSIETVLSEPQRPDSPRLPKPTGPRQSSRKLTSLSAESSNVDGADASGVPPPSPSADRWNSIRQNVLATRPETPPLPESVYKHQPSSSTSSVFSLPPPKQSRFAARLGFRQVVEVAREAAVDESRRFADEVQRAYTTAQLKLGDLKSDWDQNIASNSQFASSTLSFGQSTAPSKRHELRTQPSTMTLGGGSSLKNMLQTLMRFSTPSGDGSLISSTLPHESQVLAALLTPFLLPGSGPAVEEERFFAIEAFDLIIRTWTAHEEAGIERCLWCCKAARTLSSPLRSRIVTNLSNLLVSDNASCSAQEPASLKTLVSGLFTLIPFLACEAASAVEENQVQVVNNIIGQIIAGRCGYLNTETVEEEYSVSLVTADDYQLIRVALIEEALANCLENSSKVNAWWMVENMIEDHWPAKSENITTTPLLVSIRSKKLKACSRFIQDTMSSEPGAFNARIKLILWLMQSRIIPESESNLQDTKESVALVVLHLMTLSNIPDAANWAVSVVRAWYADGNQWKAAFEAALKVTIGEKEWAVSTEMLNKILSVVPDEIRKSVVISFVPILNEHLVAKPPVLPLPALTALLTTLASSYPNLFFKPFFSCAASSKELTVAVHLCTLTVLSKCYPDYWKNAEMICVALMNGKAGKFTLGQTVLLLEIIGHLQAARHAKELITDTADSSLVQTARFALELETRLGIILEAKEEVPLVQQMLLCMLFREIRLLTRSFKVPTWLSRTLNWFVEYHNATEDEHDLMMSDCDSVEQLYAMTGGGVRPMMNKRRTTVVLSYIAGDGGQSASTNMIPFAAGQALVASFSRGFIPHALKLFVAMSHMISPVEYDEKIGPLIWREHLENNDYIAPACFLAQQCAERSSEHVGFVTDVEVDLKSSHSGTRLSAIKKLNAIILFRFSILSQPALSDRAHRLFKLARGPLSFVSTDLGSSRYIPEDDEQNNKTGMPLELRQRLHEIGWTEEEKTPNERVALINTPISSLAVSEWQQELDRLEAETTTSSAAPSSPILGGAQLLRRNSSNGGPTTATKRRAIFVPGLAAVFPSLALLLQDSDFSVAFAARECLVDLLKNDPTLITRPSLDLISENCSQTITTIRNLLHACRDPMPPGLSHHLFNSLAGYLKHLSKHADAFDRGFEMTIPVLSKLVSHVNGFMGVRDLRKAKLELTFIPSGHLWFPPNSPACFPTHLTTTRDWTSIAVIRASQNIAFLDMLKKSPPDVQIIRRTMTRLVLPSLTDKALVLDDYLPKLATTEVKDPLCGVSLILSRSYLLLVAQIFRSFSRHVQDRADIAVFVEGINRILLRHGDDIGVVSHALIALMVAMTRFKRMFAKGGGFTLFMPALFKVYSQAESHIGIREAIEFAVHRFYAIHSESFLFQTLEILGHICQAADVKESDRIGRVLFHLFSTLSRPPASRDQDAAGIHGLNQLEEKNALLVSTADEQPQTFLANLRSTDQGPVMDIPDEYVAKLFSMGDFVRILLTVIAHDPTIIRAQVFLRILRHLAKFLYTAEQSRDILGEGITALGEILLKFSGKGRVAQADVNTIDDPNLFLENKLLESSKKPSDLEEMMLDYLSLCVAFISAGGWLDSKGSSHIMDIIRIHLSGNSPSVDRVSAFFADYTKGCLLRENINAKELEPFFDRLSTVMASAFCGAIDFTGLYEALTIFYATSPLAPALTRPLVNICTTALNNLESEDTFSSQQLKSSIIGLLAQGFNHEAAVLSMLGRRTPTYNYLSYVLLPLVLKLSAGYGPGGESWKRTIHASTWTRLFTYALNSLEYQPSKNDGSTLGIGIVVISLHILKIVSVQTEELSVWCPDVWSRLAVPLLSVLAGGNARFALGSADQSPFASPNQSPIDRSTDNPPRMVDYLLWSFLHFMCLYRSPIMLQMRLFMQEKVYELNIDLHMLTPLTPRGRRLSAFSKRRRRVSGTPQLSPSLSPMMTPARDLSVQLTPEAPSRQAGFQRSPISPSAGGTRIVHLGPISNPTFGRSVSVQRETVETVFVKSSTLIKLTYQRIRLVQSACGYDTLLPLPNGYQDEEFVRQSWSRKDVIEALNVESALLLEEFSAQEPITLDSFSL